MTLSVMYPGMVNSPELALNEAHDASTVNIIVTGTIASLPTAPNIFVIGTGEDAETIYYPTDATGTDPYTFSGVTRAFQGTAKIWEAGTSVARLFTEYDYDAIIDNITTLSTKSGQLTAYSAIFTDAAPALDQTALPTNGFPLPNAQFLDGASRTVEVLFWKFNVEGAWTDGILTANIEWFTDAAATDNVVWQASAVRIPSAGDYETVLPVVATFTASANAGAYKRNITANSAMTITGTGNCVLLKLVRYTTGDTLTGNADFVALNYTYSVA